MTPILVIIAVLAGASMMIWGLGSLLVPGFSSRKLGFILLLCGLIVVVNASLYVRDHYWESDAAAAANHGGGRAGGGLLSQPEAVCRLLADHGLTPDVQPSSGQIWGKATPMYYSCQASHLLQRGRSSIPLVYRVQSDGGDRVDLIRLQTEISETDEESDALESFKNLSSVLFERLSLSQPDGFVSALDNRTFRQFDQPSGTVELFRDRLETGYRLRMEIRPESQRP